MKNKLLLGILIIITAFISGCDKGMDRYVIELKSNPTTGYTWKYSVEGEDKIQIIEGFESPLCDECDGVSTFTVTGIEKGNATIYFTYNKEWEVEEDNKEAVYEFKVMDDLKVSLKKKSGNYFK